MNDVRKRLRGESADGPRKAAQVATPGMAPRKQSEGDPGKNHGPSAARAWTVGGVIVALCVVASLAALWVFDVIDLPGVGRFRDRMGSVSPSSSSSSASQRSSSESSQVSPSAGAGVPGTGTGGAAPALSAGLGKSLARQGAWPASTGAKKTDTKALSDATHDFLSHTGSPAQEGYVIANGDGTIASSSNADTLMEPASTLKTLTALAATDVLDMDSTLDTDVGLVPEEKTAGGTSSTAAAKTASKTASKTTSETSPSASKTTSHDTARTIVLRGGGDMLLGAGKSDPWHINGRAGLATLAQKTAAALRAAGIGSVRLVADTTLFGPVRRPATMTEDYVQIGYFAPTSALAVDEGRQSAVGSDPDSAARSTVPRTEDPAAAAVASFASSLSQAGIRLTNARSSDGAYAVPAATAAQRKSSRTPGARLARVSSAPLRQILRLTLRLSDNTLAEEFGRLVALRTKADNSPAGATKAIAGRVRRQGVDLDGASLADCSGLSPGSRLSPMMLFHVMRRLRLHAEESALEGLPVVTADRQGYGDHAAGRVRLKSGSLDTVVSDSGVVLRTNGGYFYYSAIVNVPEGQWDARSQGLSALHALAGRLVTL